MKPFSLFELLFNTAPNINAVRQLRVRKGFGLIRGASTKRGNNKRGIQRKREAAKLREMTPLLPPSSGKRRLEFSSPTFGVWLPLDTDRGLQHLAA